MRVFLGNDESSPAGSEKPVDDFFNVININRHAFPPGYAQAGEKAAGSNGG